MGAVNEVTDATFDEVVLKSDKPVLVDFWADWCGPCKQVAPIIEELANTHGDKVTFVKMDTNTNPVTPANNHVLGLPTIQVYVGGELVKAFKGAKSEVGAARRRSRNTSDPARLSAPGLGFHASDRGVDSDDVVAEEIDTPTGGPGPQRVAALAAFGRHDLESAGGKAANLGELVRAGLPVPPGFVLTTAAYREFVEAHQLRRPDPGPRA